MSDETYEEDFFDSDDEAGFDEAYEDEGARLVADSPTRRRLLGALTVLLGGAPVVGGLFATMRAGLAPAKDNRPKRIPLCKLAEVPEDGIKQVTISYQSRSGPKVDTVGRVVFVTRDPGSGEVLALSGECTHLSCPVQTRELKLETGSTAPLTCPCHGGAFSRTGKVLDGPPQRPLDRFKVSVPKQPEETIYIEF